MLTSISDYYRLPEDTMTFCASSNLSSNPGFFAFHDIVCFGRCSAPVNSSADGPLHDCRNNLEIKDGAHWLAFNPDEVAENLRLERYTSATKSKMLESRLYKSLRAAYYMLRPLLPVEIRKHIQRAHSLGWREVAFPKWPLDLSLDNLFTTLLSLAMRAQGIERLPFIWFWPDGYDATVILTHDVETLAGRNFCSPLMTLAEEYEMRGSFQVVPEQRYEVPESYLSEIRERGFEVNIHDLNHDGNLFRDHKTFLERAKRINEYGAKFGALGFRSAVLYRNSDWLSALDFTYDMSIPNSAPLDPQRGGCCTAKPYSIGHLIELPLTTIQDYSLFHLLGTYEIDIWLQQIEALLKEHGLLSFLIHPDYVIESDAANSYRRLLAHLRNISSQQNIWFPLPRDVAQWWKMRSQMSLQRRGDAWEIVGIGAERATLAWAVLREGNLVYEQSGRCDAFAE